MESKLHDRDDITYEMCKTLFLVMLSIFVRSTALLPHKNAIVTYELLHGIFFVTVEIRISLKNLATLLGINPTMYES